MPTKQKQRRSHHKGHHKEKHSKRFMKVYAPYLPLLLIIVTGFFIASSAEFKAVRSSVLSYATDMSDASLLSESNKAREKNGLPSLSLNTPLDAAAQAKAEDMAARNYWSHTTPDGQEPWTFIDTTNYSYAKAAENLAYGFMTSSGTVSGWMNSPGHRANVLDKDLREVGFGIVNVANYQNKGAQTIVVAMYGQPSETATPASATNSPTEEQLDLSGLTLANQSDRPVTYVQSATKNASPWLTIGIAIAAGIAGLYIGITHTRSLHRVIRRSEKYIIKHPLVDITVVAFIALTVVLLQNVGRIQ